MKKIVAISSIVIIYILLSSGSIAAKDKNPVVEFDFSIYKIEANNYKQAAALAMIHRGWIIEKVANGKVVGKRPQEFADRVEIDYSKKPKVTIRFLSSSVTQNPGWLTNLKIDMLAKLVSCP